jgi:Holliday junction resolvasome RuvABC endonuclease subunit
MTRGATLALDLATTTGFALLRADGRIESGAVKFAPKAKDTPGARWIKFTTWLGEMVAAHPSIALVVYEDVVFIGGPGGAYASQVYGGFVAMMQMFFDRRAIPYIGHGVPEVKKKWTGRGDAKKHEMIARCQELGFNPSDDNEADAIALLHVATGRAPPVLAPKRPRLKPSADTKTAALDIMPAAPF